MGSRGASSSSNELGKLKETIGVYGKSLLKSKNIRYENGKLISRTMIGDRVEPDRPTRNAGNYKVFVRHFSSAEPYSHVFIANTKNGSVYEIPEIVSSYNQGALKDITERLKSKR